MKKITRAEMIRLAELLQRVKFSLFGKHFKVKGFLDKISETRMYLQVIYTDTCRNTGEESEWHGRKWYLSEFMTDDEVIKTAFAACKSAVEHEIMEGFTVDGVVLFNPHVSFEALLSISHKEVRRS